MLRLILPEESYWQSFQEGLQEFKNYPTPFDTFAIRSSFDYGSFKNYQNDCENYRCGQGLKPEYAPFTRLWLMNDEKFIGIFDVRHFLTEKLMKSGGHIAYAVIPSQRKKGYAVQGLKLCCKYAHDVLGIDKVLLICDADNTASYHTMKNVMIDFGGIEASPMIVDGYEEKRVWIRTEPRPVQIRPLAVAVIKNQDKVLAFRCYDEKKNEEFFRLIGGGIEFGEKGEETVKREFKEELGFEPINIRYLTTVENIFTFNGHKGHEIVLVYEADLPEALKKQTKFYGVEEDIKDKYAEYVTVGKQNRIYPEGIF